MKQVHGWWLPDGDTHFEDHLLRGPQVDGRGTYQHRKFQAAMERLRPDRRFTAIDIGAHVGFWSVPLVGEFGRVVAFEPVHELAQCWHKNVGCNAELFEVALGDHNDSIAMDFIDANSGNSCVSVTGHGDITLTRLDEYKFQDVDFIKIDTEGYELPVIIGAKDTITRCKPVMVVEQKPGNAERYGYGQFAAVNLLQSWGARVLWIKAGDYCMGWNDADTN